MELHVFVPMNNCTISGIGSEYLEQSSKPDTNVLQSYLKYVVLHVSHDVTRKFSRKKENLPETHIFCNAKASEVNLFASSQVWRHLLIMTVKQGRDMILMTWQHTFEVLLLANKNQKTYSEPEKSGHTFTDSFYKIFLGRPIYE